MILHISSEVNVDQKDEIFLARYVREVVFFCDTAVWTRIEMCRDFFVKPV